MTDQNSTFKTVMRGYDPAEVDRRLDELTAAVTSLTQQRDGLATRVQELHDTASGTSEPPGYEHLGARVGQIGGGHEHPVGAEILDPRDDAVVTFGRLQTDPGLVRDPVLAPQLHQRSPFSAGGVAWVGMEFRQGHPL